jgi:hypothetical protein
MTTKNFVKIVLKELFDESYVNASCYNSKNILKLKRKKKTLKDHITELVNSLISSDINKETIK